MIDGRTTRRSSAGRNASLVLSTFCPYYLEHNLKYDTAHCSRLIKGHLFEVALAELFYHGQNVLQEGRSI